MPPPLRAGGPLGRECDHTGDDVEPIPARKSRQPDKLFFDGPRLQALQRVTDRITVVVNRPRIAIPA